MSWDISVWGSSGTNWTNFKAATRTQSRWICLVLWNIFAVGRRKTIHGKAETERILVGKVRNTHGFTKRLCLIYVEMSPIYEYVWWLWNISIVTGWMKRQLVCLCIWVFFVVDISVNDLRKIWSLHSAPAEVYATHMKKMRRSICGRETNKKRIVDWTVFVCDLNCVFLHSECRTRDCVNTHLLCFSTTHTAMRWCCIICLYVEFWAFQDFTPHQT